MTQAELARRIGVNRQFIYKVKVKERFFSLEQAILVAHVLNCSAHDLYEYKIHSNR
ncbi:helix-turn-helix domain-containing protein [Paenibacillus cellulosilyticus]